MRKIGIGLTAAVLIAAAAAPAIATQPNSPTTGLDPNSPGHKVEICHATSSDNPVQYWELITVDIASSGRGANDGLKKIEGHVGHTDAETAKKDGRLDLIPTFTYVDPLTGYGGYGVPGNEDQWEAWLVANDLDLAHPPCGGPRVEDNE